MVNPPPSSVARRPYSTTVPVRSDDDDKDVYGDDTARYQFLNCDGMTQEEAAAAMADAEAEVAARAEAKLQAERDWVPGTRKRPLRVSYDLADFDLDGPPKWTPRDRRCGALGIKVGMMPVWDEWGERHAATVVFVDTNVVMEVKTVADHGYDAVVVGAGERKLKRVTKPLLGHYARLGLTQPPNLVREFRVQSDVDDHVVAPEPGARIHARHFVPGQQVDVAGISKGKGFQGAMKRHNFKGLPATHGVSKSHRSLGSTGQCQDPGKVFKGKKMAGRMGTDRVTVQNLKVLKIDRGRNLLYLKGAVPGQKGNWIEIRDAVKKPLWGKKNLVEGDPLLPPLPTFDYEEGIDGCGRAGYEGFMPTPDIDPFIPRDIEKIPVRKE